MKINVYVSTGKVGSKCSAEFEIDDEELADLSDEQKPEYIEEQAREVMFGMIEWGFDEVE